MNPAVFVLGDGPVGLALATACLRAGLPVLGIHGRDPERTARAGSRIGVLGSGGPLPAAVALADVVVVAVGDRKIPAAAAELGATLAASATRVVLHTAGSVPSAEVLAAIQPRVAGVGTLHPLLSVTSSTAGNGAEALRRPGAAFGIEGDPPAVAIARHLVESLGARALLLRPGTLALYHAGAVLASNHVVALAELATGLFEKAGIERQDAVPGVAALIASVAENLLRVGLPEALTGPIVRGDAGTVERHLEALARSAPTLLDLYQRLGRETLALARQRPGGPGDETAARLTRLLST